VGGVNDAALSAAALRGMRIERTSLLTDGIQDVWELLVQLIQQQGYRDTWRWRVGCRLLERLERSWPPDPADNRDVMLLVARAKRFLTPARVVEE
jgi:hypothetical protein